MAAVARGPEPALAALPAPEGGAADELDGAVASEAGGADRIGGAPPAGDPDAEEADRKARKARKPAQLRLEAQESWSPPSVCSPSRSTPAEQRGSGGGAGRTGVGAGTGTGTGTARSGRGHANRRRRRRRWYRHGRRRWARRCRHGNRRCRRHRHGRRRRRRRHGDRRRRHRRRSRSVSAAPAALPVWTSTCAEARPPRATSTASIFWNHVIRRRPPDRDVCHYNAVTPVWGAGYAGRLSSSSGSGGAAGSCE